MGVEGGLQAGASLPAKPKRLKESPFFKPFYNTAALISQIPFKAGPERLPAPFRPARQILSMSAQVFLKYACHELYYT